ncbi:MAG: hypothetical protein ACREHD_16675, partial [Pirellulales bacterium]
VARAPLCLFGVAILLRRHGNASGARLSIRRRQQRPLLCCIFLKELDEEYPDDEHEDERPHVITSDQLLAAGAHSVSATGPKSRRTQRVDRDQLSLFGDDDTLPTKQPPTLPDPNGDELSEEVP